MTPAENRDNHFARLNDYSQSNVGQRWEIDEAIYTEFLEMMPPLHWRGGSFFMCEECFGGLHAKFTEEGGRYFCEFAPLPRRANALAPGIEP